MSYFLSRRQCGPFLLTPIRMVAVIDNILSKEFLCGIWIDPKRIKNPMDSSCLLVHRV